MHLVLWLAGVVLVSIGVIWTWARVTQPVPMPVHYWHAHRAQGGGVITSPIPMDETQALEWVAKMGGKILYVDREAGFIFYRPEL